MPLSLISRGLLFLVVSAGIIYAALAFGQDNAHSDALPPLPTESLIIITPRSEHEFQVEVVRDPEDMRRGLMFREDVPQGTGMLFDFGRQRRLAMWMKNTIVPLDMLFINAQGVIVDMAENTTPFSLTPIISKAPALAVLEVRAGTCNRYGISEGDRVKHPMFEVTAQ